MKNGMQWVLQRMATVLFTIYLAAMWLIVPWPSGLLLIVFGASSHAAWNKHLARRLLARYASTKPINRTQPVQHRVVAGDHLDATVDYVWIVTRQHLPDAPSNILIDGIPTVYHPVYDSPGRQRPWVRDIARTSNTSRSSG
jgi:hypothetical protein